MADPNDGALCNRRQTRIGSEPCRSTRPGARASHQQRSAAVLAAHTPTGLELLAGDARPAAPSAPGSRNASRRSNRLGGRARANAGQVRSSRRQIRPHVGCASLREPSANVLSVRKAFLQLGRECAEPGHGVVSHRFRWMHVVLRSHSGAHTGTVTAPCAGAMFNTAQLGTFGTAWGRREGIRLFSAAGHLPSARVEGLRVMGSVRGTV